MSSESSSIIRVGSRQSQLAVLQTKLIISLLQKFHPEYTFEIVTVATIGDKILDKELSKIGDRSLFTKELELALQNDTVDFVVHSLKDVPTILPKDLVLGCICARASPFDVVLMSPFNRGKRLSELPPNSVIGTSALRRIAVLKRKFSHLNFLSVRGNLSTRLQKLDATPDICDSPSKPKYDALILAQAGIQRIGWKSRIDEVLSHERYAVGQGALACECRADDNRILSLLSSIHCEAAALACIAERAFMNRLEAGCSTPISVRTHLMPGGIAGIRGDVAGKTRSLCLDVAVLSLDGGKCVEGKLATALPFAMPLDRAKRRRLDTEPSSTFPVLDEEISETEESAAKDPKAVFLGVHVSPICCIGRLRMARARRLGEALAERLSASGAAEILAEIRATANPVTQIIS